MTVRFRRLGIAAAAVALALVAVPAAAEPPPAASLEPVTDFGTNPGNLEMFHYAPDDAGAGRPVVVALHGCTQDAQTYHDNSGWSKLADSAKFHLVYAQQPGANNVRNCFNWFEPADQTRDQGEARSIAQMVQHAVDGFGADADRVYVTGLSAGGAMSAVMLAAYPDVFAGGSVVAGIPYRCATNVSAALQCMNPGVDKTPPQWGDLVRGASGYDGPRPRVAVWHGDADSTVAYANAAESVEQWTDTAGVGTEPTETADLPGGTTLEKYGDDAVRRYTVAGMAHGLPVDPGDAADQCGTAGQYFLDTICSAHYDAQYFGLVG